MHVLCQLKNAHNQFHYRHKFQTSYKFIILLHPLTISHFPHFSNFQPLHQIQPSDYKSHFIPTIQIKNSDDSNWVLQILQVMRDFPSCFGENGVQIADSSSSSSSSSSLTTKTAQNLVTCVYECKFNGRLRFILVTWTKHLMGQALTLQIHNPSNQCLCKLDIKPWLFSKKKGFKNLQMDSTKTEVFWDFTNAKFGSGPEPLEGFYLAILCQQEMVFLIGDLQKEAYKKIDSYSDSESANSSAIFVARREHIFGKRFYLAKTQFCHKGQTHNLSIECDAGVGVGASESLVIRVDSRTAMQIKRLRWKFRGNETIVVDGIPVEVFWDVHNWLFGSGMSSAVFMFQTHVPFLDQKVRGRGLDVGSSGLDCSKLEGLDFSLVLYAWRNE